MKRWLASLFVVSLVCLCLGSSVKAETELKSEIGGISLGLVKVGTTEVWNAAWHPDFHFGPFGLAADVNLGSGDPKPAGYEPFVLRYVEYDDQSRGLRYGVLDKLTWGNGLLLDNYSTKLTGSVIPNSEQLAWLGYYTYDMYTLRAFTTRTGVNGVRVEEKINPLLTLGQSIVTDGDGVAVTGVATRQAETGFSVDAAMPLPFNFAGFAEYAQLQNRGAGMTAGIGWAQDIMVASCDLMIGYRQINAGFVPGYFNADYETNPINLASIEASTTSKNGYLGRFNVRAMGMATLNVQYENYNDSQAALYADLQAKLPQEVEVTGYYKQPSFNSFRSLDVSEGAIMGGTVSYPVNEFIKAVVHYKRFFNPTTAQIETDKYYEMKVSL